MIIVSKDFDFGFMIVKMLSTFGEFYSMEQKKSLTEARLSINDQTEPQHPQHLQRLLSQMDL
jgi:hypothetical protein